MKYTCDVEKALDLLGGKWGTLILRDLLKGPRRYSEFSKNLEINPRTLTLKLRLLEKHQVIKRTVYPEVPPRVVYEITKYGMEVKPIIEALRTWGRSEPPVVTKL